MGRRGLIPTADCIDRWHLLLRTRGRVVPEARLRRDAETSAFLRFRRTTGVVRMHAFGVTPIRALGTSRSLVPLG
jgi:hypothetical protein